MIRHALLVEGKDELTLFEHLLKSHPLGTTAKVLDCGGIRQFGAKLAAVVDQPWFGDLRTITVVRDAEDAADAALASVVGALEAANIQAPGEPGNLSEGPPFVRVFILPGPDVPGCLETLFVDAFRSGSPELVDCLDRLRQCVARDGLNDARWAKIFTSVILMATPGDYSGSLGRSAQKNEFAPLFDQEPLAQLRRILDRIHER